MVYMSGEAVAVAQNLGENRNLIADAVNGMLAGTHQEWVEKLEWLVHHPEERRIIASRGLKTIHERFSRQKCFEQLLSAFENV
jgi:glycosyltransferase involved in cell wall biosynthesis